MDPRVILRAELRTEDNEGRGEGLVANRAAMPFTSRSVSRRVSAAMNVSDRFGVVSPQGWAEESCGMGRVPGNKF